MSGLKLMAKIPHLSRYVRPQSYGKNSQTLKVFYLQTQRKNTPSLQVYHVLQTEKYNFRPYKRFFLHRYIAVRNHNGL